ncbi:MAG: Endoribonuclease MazF9 [Legionellaceae bacterium]
MKRGEIYYADLNPTVGSEINKQRPVLIISNNANNRVSSTITVLPITSNVSKIYPFEVFLSMNESGLQKDSKVQCHQIRTIDRKRLKTGCIGNITKVHLISAIETALKLHLSID